MCDLRIASENASFGENFVKLGLIPGDGGAWFLPRVVGRRPRLRCCRQGF
ncbi:enoyl-CoA hydratase-related protein [Bosea sp. RAF48]